MDVQSEVKKRVVAKTYEFPRSMLSTILKQEDRIAVNVMKGGSEHGGTSFRVFKGA